MTMQPLSNEQLHRYAPSIFADHAYHAMSDRYQFIPTIQVVEGLRQEGFFPVRVSQSRARLADKREFTKHSIRFQQSGTKQVGDVFPEIVLVNSHDGLSAYQLHAGLYRLVCSNGMVVGDSILEAIKVRHKGQDVIKDVIEGTFEVVQEIPQLLERIDDYKAVTLSEPQQKAFAAAALTLRYDDPMVAPFPPERLLQARRWDDKAPDLWHTFNRIQENMTKGGIAGRNANGRRTRTREIKAVSEDIRLNKALWTLADELAKVAV